MRGRVFVGPVSPVDAFDGFRRMFRVGEPALFLDGAQAAGGMGREAETSQAESALRSWSFAAVAPSAALCVRDGRVFAKEGGGEWAPQDVPPWEAVRAFVRSGMGPPVAGVPFPFGVAGLVSYEAGRLVESLPSLALDESGVPEVLLFRFDAVLAVPASGGASRVLHRPGCEAAARAVEERLRDEPAAFVARGTPGALRPRVSQKTFEAMVERAKEHVRAGDVFQVNLSHRLETHSDLAPLDLYARLRVANPAPFSAFFESGDLPAGLRGFQVLSSSPERLFRLEGRRLEARPIAGTRPRGEDAVRDAALVEELRGDPKEQAEHVMLVDLARNDLGRVARFGSVRVPRLLTVETYRTVHHLVSVVEADLEEGKDAVDALVGLFPGGTITGAPKVRAMEVIEEIEPVRRGVYTGSLGWFGPTGDCDFNILIRTLFVRDGEVHLQVGAGIVEESVPEREYQETLAKAQGLLRALRGER